MNILSFSPLRQLFNFWGLSVVQKIADLICGQSLFLILYKELTQKPYKWFKSKIMRLFQEAEHVPHRST
jgi:hypothetical protein